MNGDASEFSMKRLHENQRRNTNRYYKIGYNRTITQTNHEISGNGSEEGSSHLEVNTEVPAHGLGGCNASTEKHNGIRISDEAADVRDEAKT